MELDELKSAWKTTNERLDRVEGALQRKSTRSAANWLRLEPIVELALGVLTALWTGGYLADHAAKIAQDPIGASPGGLIFAMAVITISLSIRQLALVGGLDYAGAIIESQRRLARLKALRVRTTQAMFLAGLPLWMVFPIFALQSVSRFEVYRAFDGGWIVANLIFGVVVAGGLVIAARKAGDRESWLRKLNDLLAGTEIRRAEDLLAEVSVFARD